MLELAIGIILGCCALGAGVAMIEICPKNDMNKEKCHVESKNSHGILISFNRCSNRSRTHLHCPFRRQTH